MMSAEFAARRQEMLSPHFLCASLLVTSSANPEYKPQAP